jgi:hypothetical protein
VKRRAGGSDALLTKIVGEGKMRFDPPGVAIDAQALFPEPYEA